jgi:hypothetical protein
MKEKQYSHEIGTTTGQTIHMLEALHDNGLAHGLKREMNGYALSDLPCQWLKRNYSVKQEKGLYPKDYIEKALDDAPGIKIVLSSPAPNDVLLVAPVYRYSQKTTQFFVATLITGNTSPRNPCIMK